MKPGATTVDRDAAPTQIRFEGERVETVLKAFGLADTKWELLDAHEREFGTPRRLTFAGFRRRFPTFPVVLAARHVGRLNERVDVNRLLRRPDRLFLTDLYLEALARGQDEAGDRPVGLVVPFDGYRGGCVIHNGSFDTGGTRVQYAVPGDAPPYRLTAEPFVQLLAFLAAGRWTPDGPDAVALPATGPDATSAPAVLAPWMTKQLGTGPGFALYAWLTAILASPSPRHRQHLRRGKNGTRLVAATRAELSALTGLSPDVIKRGMSQLRAQGLVATARRDGGMLIAVTPPEEPR